MMTVRFPNGFSIQYNDANYAHRFQAGYTDLYNKKDDRWIAQVPNTCLIEVQTPCRMYNPIDKVSPSEFRLADMEKSLRSLKANMLKLNKSKR